MENVYLRAKIEERTAQAQVLENLQNTAADAKRDLTDDERKTYDSIVKRLAFLDEEIGRIAEAQKGAAKFTEIYGATREAEARARAARDRARQEAEQQAPPPEERGTWGQRFVASPALQDYHGHGASQPFQIEGPYLDAPYSLEERATSWSFPQGTNITAGGFGDAMPAMTWSGPTEPGLRTPLFDVIGRVPTGMGSVEYFYWHTDPEQMASEVPEGQLKPEAAFSGELKAVPIATYAWWKGLTRQALDDIPMIQTIVDTQLRRGIIRRIEAEAATALTSNTDIPDTDGGELLRAIRTAIGMIDEAGFYANAVALNPLDWAALDMSLLLVTAGQPAPTGPTINRGFWNLQPIALSAIPEGTAYVGDFREAITFFDRRQVNVLITDSHADYFLRNKLVLLAEARGKVVVTNADALVKCTGTVDGAGEPDTNGETRAARAARAPRQRAAE